MYLYKGKSQPKLSDDTYCNLVKECTWAEHLTSLPKQGVGALLSVSAFNHERSPMGEAPNMSAKEEGRHSFGCFCI